MLPVTWEEVCALELGRLERGENGATLERIVADSREARAGDLFVALNTGVRYVDDARARGAATLVPHDQEAALAALARLVRGKSDAHGVAVVGSVGKTTTKDVLGALCARQTPTIWAERSLNNEIGVPLTIFRLEADTRVLVAEMGMRGLGQIAYLCEIARPTVAVVTHIGPEHLELVGTVDAVARANAEAIEALPPGGVAVVPSRSRELAPYLERDDIDIRRFSPDDVELDGSRATFHLDGATLQLELPFTQRHLATNVLAALHGYAALGLPLERAHEGVVDIRLSPWRGDVLELEGGGVVVNDAYNANPDSMRAALEDLANRATDGRRVAILGEMAELGAAAEQYHREIGRLAAALGIEVVGVGERARLYDPDEWAATPEEAIAVARDYLRPGDVVLVKASRAVGLEGIAPEIANFARAWSPS